MLHLHAVAPIVALVALAISGCGGSKAPSTTSAVTGTTSTAAQSTTGQSTVSSKPSLPRAEFIAKGEAICTRVNTQLDASTVKSLADYGRVLPQAAIYEQAEHDELSHLVPPASMSHDWKQFLAGVQKWSEDSAILGRYAKENKLQSAAALAHRTTLTHERLARIAKRNGFKECALV